MKGILVGLIVWFCALFITPTAQAQFDNSFIRGVDQAATGANNGLSWADAYTDLQDALDFASDPANGITSIWVAAAEPYLPSKRTDPPEPRTATFSLINGVGLYGGFLGNAPGGDETELSERNPELNITILSGDIGVEDDPDDNCFRVVLAEDVGSQSILDGFTVTDGTADGEEGFNNGGGLCVRSASPTVVRCRIANNRAASSSGGIDIRGALEITAEPIFVNCSVFDNTVTYTAGGGVGIFESADATFVNCIFYNNECLGMSTNGGGAVYVGDGGGGNFPGSGTFTHCTFTANQVADDGDGGAIQIFVTASATLTSCLLWGNFSGTDPDQIDGSATVNYSNIQGGWAGGTGNIDEDPKFSDPSNGNYRLYYGSPCIDAADTDSLPLDAGDIDEDGIILEELPLDLDLIDRRTDDPDTTDTGTGDSPIVDMGAYEFAPCPADINSDCMVSVADLLILLDDWGACTDCNICPSDINDDCTVGVADLLILLADWGICSCSDGTEPLSLQDELDDACLTMVHWNDFVAVMGDPNASQAKKDRYKCWMVHYLDHCDKCTCTHIPTCPSPDPYT